MKSLTILLISTFLISLIFSCSKGKSDIEYTLNAMQESIPKLVEEIKNMKECNTSELKPICSKGYRYWNSQSEAQYFKGVSQDYENIRNFLAVILDYLPIEKKDAENVGDLMALSISADALAVDIMGLDVIYNRNNVANAANKGCYFTFLLEKSCEHSNEYDFLFTMINSGFKLGKEIFLLEEGEGNWFKGSTKQKPVEREPDLSRDQYMALLKLLQISTFANAGELVKMLKGV